jgi:hypothetical protein
MLATTCPHCGALVWAVTLSPSLYCTVSIDTTGVTGCGRIFNNAFYHKLTVDGYEIAFRQKRTAS